MREWLARAVLVVLSLASTVGCGELLVRFAMNPYACHERLGWTFAAGSRVLRVSRAGEYAHLARFDARGLRDDDRPFDKPANTYRILLLGDSFMASLQVPRAKSFASLLEEDLGKELPPGLRVEVVNAGIDGYGTAQELLLFREMGLRFQPDVVLLGVFAANDVADNSPLGGSWNHHLASHCGRPYLQVQSGRIVPVEEGRLLRPVAGNAAERVLRRSLLYSTLRPVTISDAPETGFVQSAVFESDPRPAVAEAWALTEQLIRALRAELTELGIPLVVARVPSKREVWPRPGRTPGQDDTRPGRLLLGFLERESIAHLDLTPALFDPFQQSFFARDSHWNERGQLVVAESIQDWLLRNCAEIGLPAGPCAGSPGPNRPPGGRSNARAARDGGR